MAWVKIDDQMPEHPKIVAVSIEARWMHVEGICYSNRNLTDGFVPDGAVQRMDAPVDSGRSPWQIAEELVAGGLWKTVESGYLVHDYLHHQQSRERVEADRKAARERMAKVRDSRSSPELRNSSPEVRLTEVEEELKDHSLKGLVVDVGNGVHPAFRKETVE